MLRFVESQTSFVIKTTARISNYQDFLIRTMAWYCSILFCMYLQTISKQFASDDHSRMPFLSLSEIPWRQIIGMRNIIST